MAIPLILKTNDHMSEMTLILGEIICLIENNKIRYDWALYERMPSMRRMPSRS
jgi:hypothetical protein